MRHLALKLFLACSLAVAIPVQAFAQDAAPAATSRGGFDSTKLSSIVDWIKSDVEKGRIPGAVILVARDGQILLHEAVGWADKAKQIPMRRETLHPIASSTKLITTVAALRLFEANQLKIMAPIATYLPELKDLKVSLERRDAVGNITTEIVAPSRQPNVHDLMTHRAGFTYFFHLPNNPLRNRYRELGIDRTDRMTAEEMLQKLGTLPLAFSPGTSFEYSIGTDLLGHIIERVTNKSLDIALKELVLDPLNMSDTTFYVPPSELPRFARPLSQDPDPWVFDFVDPTTLPKRFSGGGGLASTTSDYYRILQLMLNGGTLEGKRLLSPATWRWAMADQIGSARGVAHPGDGYSWNLFNPVRVAEGGPVFPGSVGDVYWGGITGPRYFFDPKERLIGILFMQGPSQRAAYHAELRAMVYGAMVEPAGRF